MRTAEEIIKETFPNVVYRYDGLMQAEINANDIRKAINIARKEAIEECAEIAGTDCDIYNHSVDKESILSLINELK